MYRWISSSRRPETIAGGTKADAAEAERRMWISFSVPTTVVSRISPPPEDKDAAGRDMDIDDAKPIVDSSLTASTQPPRCAVPGCGATRKYRLVRNWQIGACGMSHLKMLEQVGTVGAA